MKNGRFYLHKLPMLARIEVIRSMEFAERLKLSFTSLRLRICVWEARTKFTSPRITLENGFATLAAKNEECEIFCDALGFKVNKKRLGRLKTTSGTLISNLSDLMRHLQHTFSKTYFTFFLSNNIPKSVIKEIHSDPILIEWAALKVENQIMKADDLDLIMERNHKERAIDFYNTVFPINYRNENALQFGCMDFSDARWLNGMDLWSMKETSNISFGVNRLSPTDINMFIDQWISVDHDMFLWMDIQLDPNLVLERTLAGKVVLQHFYKSRSLCFTLAKSDKRKHPLLCLDYTENLRLTAWAADEPFKPQQETLEAFGREYEILRILERKVELENVWMTDSQEYKQLLADLKTMNVQDVDGLASIVSLGEEE